jgi:hypothetical protein
LNARARTTYNHALELAPDATSVRDKLDTLPPE